MSNKTVKPISPAPWIVQDKDYDRFGKTILIQSERGNYVCELVRTSDFNEDANARLIASAPELLKQCKAIFSELRNMEWASPTHAEKILTEFNDKYYDILKSLIEKSEVQQ